MAGLVVGSRLVTSPIEDILNALRSATGKPREFRKRGDNFQVTCPFHKEGKESHPSCQVYCGNSNEIEYGYMHCFTCGENGPLWHFVGECLGKGDEAGKEWLARKFTSALVDDGMKFYVPPLSTRKVSKEIPESILSNLEPWHPYMAKRHLSRKVCEEFGVGYDPKENCLVFPVRDETGKLVMLTRRSVDGKRFMVDADAEKPVYLLDRIRKNGISEVTVVESQINALTLWGWGYPAVALFGTGTKKQYDLLNKSGVRTFYLALDGDEAGIKGVRRLLNGLSPCAFKYVISLPWGKDVNDLDEDAFAHLPVTEGNEWLASHGGFDRKGNAVI